MTDRREEPDIQALVEGVRVAASRASEAASHLSSSSQAHDLLKAAIDELVLVIHAAGAPFDGEDADVGRIMRGMRLVSDLVAGEAIPGIESRDAGAIFAAQRYVRDILRAHEKEYVATTEPVAVVVGGHESCVTFRPPPSPRAARPGG